MEDLNRIKKVRWVLQYYYKKKGLSTSLQVIKKASLTLIFSSKSISGDASLPSEDLKNKRKNIQLCFQHFRWHKWP